MQNGVIKVSNLNKTLTKATWGFDNLPQNLLPFCGPPIKVFGLHFYRHLTSYVYYFPGGKISGEEPGLSYEGWRKRIKKVCPWQYYIREEILDNLFDYIIFFDVYPRSFIPKNKSIKFVDYFFSIFKNIEKIFNNLYYGNLPPKHNIKNIFNDIKYIILLLLCLDLNSNNFFIRKIRQVKYDIKNYFFPKNIIKFTTLPNHYNDLSEQLYYIPFELFENFMKEVYDCHSYDDEDGQKFIKEANEILDWWSTKGKTNYYENLKDQLYNNRKICGDFIVELNKIEEQQDRDLIDNINKLYKLRGKLWL
jgi:hypothetical protein